MKGLICLLLCCVLLAGLVGCDTAEEPYIPTGDGLTWDEDYTGPAVTQPEEEVQEQKLSLACYMDDTLNPYFCNDFTNRVLFSLLYQGLFTTDREYNVTPVLCSKYSVSENMRTYVFYVDPAATFSDGTPVTAQDVVASLTAAKDSGFYRSRFSKIRSFSLTDDGGVQVQCNTAYENLPILLDVPIVKEEEVSIERPIGSGPYILQDYGMGAQLVRRINWWCQSTDLLITAPVIQLVEAESINHIRDEFQFGDLSLVQADTGSDRYADYLCDYELWDCENGIFLYLACNRESSIFKSAENRRLLTYGIDRETLVTEHYRSFARAASLPASPMSPYYNQNLASQYQYDLVAFTTAVQNASLEGRTITMLVNGKDSHRLRVAQSIEEMLEKGGLSITIIFPEEDMSFTKALETMDYDMYLAQTILSPNMDLSHFLSDTGNLNYGGINDVTAYTICQQALENHGNYYTLHQTVMDKGLIIPILFRSYAIYATRGLLTDLQPSRDHVFYYSIGKTMDSAYIRMPEGE